MKKLRYIAVLFVAVAGFWGSIAATAGASPVSSDGLKTVSDTTEPAPLTDKLPIDTSGPVAIITDTTEDHTEPPTGNPPLVRAPLETVNEEEIPASELYDEFDTTIVHSEKFDALTFDDTMMIVLNDPAHSKYVHPFNGPTTSGFGFRKYRYHFGEDINLETGDSVRCAFDGKVRIAQRSKTYGYVVVVRHSNGLETYYAHLSKLLVHPNEDVNAGTILGLGGNTGHSFGSHLHFEVRFRGQPIDPNYVIDFKHQCVRADTIYLTKSNFKYLAESYKVRHYSKKKKKTWYTYYTPGGAHYATPEARRIMAQVPEPSTPGTSAANTASVPAQTPPSQTEANAAPAKSAPSAKNPPPAKKPVTTTTAKTAPGKPTTHTTTTKPAGTAVYHTIKKGETLSALAVKYGTTVDKICKLNGIKSTSTLRIGQKVRVK